VLIKQQMFAVVFVR